MTGHGLAVALESVAERAPLPLELDVAGLPRLPEAIEVIEVLRRLRRPGERR